MSIEEYKGPLLKLLLEISQDLVVKGDITHEIWHSYMLLRNPCRGQDEIKA